MTVKHPPEPTPDHPASLRWTEILNEQCWHNPSLTKICLRSMSRPREREVQQGVRESADRVTVEPGSEMRVLIGCEFSGIVRDAFEKRGHYAVSCDLLDSETDGLHFRGDIRALLNNDGDWDLLVAFPPCTHLAVSGARWFADKRDEQRQAIAFVKAIAESPIKRIAIENPIGVLSTRWRRPDQIVQPWMFGHGETKATCLWLKNLPPLKPTNIVEGRCARVHREPPGPDRWKNRSRTYQGIADAMAEQWG